MGLSWDSTFVRTVPGMAMAAQALIGVGGGFISIFGGSALASFALWTAAIVSGLFLLTHTCNLTQTIEAAFPYMAKVHLFYLCAWTGFFTLDVLWHTIFFNFSVVFSYAELVAFTVDLVLKYRKWKSATAEANLASPSSVESGGFGETGGPPKF